MHSDTRFDLGKLSFFAVDEIDWRILKLFSFGRFFPFKQNIDTYSFLESVTK